MGRFHRANNRFWSGWSMKAINAAHMMGEEKTERMRYKRYPRIAVVARPNARE
jgi:hypothetical protein